MGSSCTPTRYVRYQTLGSLFLKCPLDSRGHRASRSSTCAQGDSRSAGCAPWCRMPHDCSAWCKCKACANCTSTSAFARASHPHGHNHTPARSAIQSSAAIAAFSFGGVECSTSGRVDAHRLSPPRFCNAFNTTRACIRHFTPRGLCEWEGTACVTSTKCRQRASAPTGTSFLFFKFHKASFAPKAPPRSALYLLKILSRCHPLMQISPALLSSPLCC